jgi:large subunit ribosomal protein L11
MDLEIKTTITIYILAQKAENTPPLGTVLGNLGVNAIKFCSEFNEFTKGLPEYLTCSVNIIIFENKSFKFSIKQPPLSSVINLVKFERDIIKFGVFILDNVLNFVMLYND